MIDEEREQLLDRMSEKFELWLSRPAPTLDGQPLEELSSEVFERALQLLVGAVGHLARPYHEPTQAERRAMRVMAQIQERLVRPEN